MYELKIYSSTVELLANTAQSIAFFIDDGIGTDTTLTVTRSRHQDITMTVEGPDGTLVDSTDPRYEVLEVDESAGLIIVKIGSAAVTASLFVISFHLNHYLHSEETNFLILLAVLYLLIIPLNFSHSILVLSSLFPSMYLNSIA